MTVHHDKIPSTMTAGEVNRELKKLAEAQSVNCQKFIEAGRGHETPDFFLDEKRATDPLSREAQRLYARRCLLSNEVERECGPGMREFPRGWRRKRL